MKVTRPRRLAEAGLDAMQGQHLCRWRTRGGTRDTLNTVEAMTTWKGDEGDDEVSRHEPPPDRKPQHEAQSGSGLIEMMRNIEDGRGAMGCADLAEPCALSARSYRQ
jgi:hypothetical protein